LDLHYRSGDISEVKNMTGEVVYFYAFDVANETQTEKVQEVLATKPLPIDVQTDHTYPKDVPLYRPLTVELPMAATLAGRPVRLILRIYDVGVVSIIARAPLAVAGLQELTPLHAPRLDDGQLLDAVARKLCADACQGLQNVMTQATEPSEPEAYTVFCLTELDGVSDANRWVSDERRAVAGLLAETPPERLSESQVNECLRVQRSFANTDVVVIDWDAALLVDLDGYVDDVLYVIELANLQLEEYRHMDLRLDRYLTGAYDDVQRHRFGLFGTYTKILRKLRLFRVDVTRLNDEVSHIGKFLGDWYLARVYTGASERFYLDHWRTSIERRLDELDKLYNVVNSEISNRRLLWLEVAIVVFFAIDLVLMVLLKK
jgi:hypothetical protein